MAVVGYATIQLIPSLQGFAGATRSQMAPIIRSTGTESGEKAGGLFGGSFVGSVSRIMASAGIYEIGSRVASGLSDAISTGIKGFADLQGYTISFKTLLGSATKANDMIRDLYAFAAKTPFDVEGAVVGAQKLINAGVAAKDVIPTLTTLGDAIGAAGGSTAEFSSALLAFSQITNRPRISTQDLYQVMNAGIPIFQLLSRALGKPIGEIQDMIEKQQLLSKDVLPKLYAQMNKEYGGAMADQAQTLTGLWSTFKDTMSQVLTKALTPVGEWLVKILPGATTQATAAIDWLQTKFTAIGQWIVDPQNKVAETFKPFIDGIKNTDWEGLLGTLGSAFSTLWTAVQPILEAMSKYLGNSIPEGVKGATSLIQGLLDVLNSDGGQAALNAGTLSDSIKGVGDKSNEASPGLLGFLGHLNDMAGTSWGATTGYAQFIGAILQGESTTNAASDALNGKFGPAMQNQAEIARVKGGLIGITFRAIGVSISTFVSQSVASIGAWGASIAGSIGSTMVRAGQAVTTGTARMIGAVIVGLSGFRTAVANGVTGGVAAVTTGVSNMYNAVTGWVGNFASAGRALIGGFVQGIRDMIGQARDAASSVVNAVSNFFPHSPAPEGPFSGRGWTLYSGRSLVDGFAAGIQQRQGGLRSLMNETFAGPVAGPTSSVTSEVAAAVSSGAGTYIGNATINSNGGNAGVINDLNFYLRTLSRGGR